MSAPIGFKSPAKHASVESILTAKRPIEEAWLTDGTHIYGTTGALSIEPSLGFHLMAYSTFIRTGYARTPSTDKKEPVLLVIGVEMSLHILPGHFHFTDPTDHLLFKKLFLFFSTSLPQRLALLSSLLTFRTVGSSVVCR